MTFLLVVFNISLHFEGRLLIRTTAFHQWLSIRDHLWFSTGHTFLYLPGTIYCRRIFIWSAARLFLQYFGHSLLTFSSSAFCAAILSSYPDILFCLLTGTPTCQWELLAVMSGSMGIFFPFPLLSSSFLFPVLSYLTEGPQRKETVELVGWEASGAIWEHFCIAFSSGWAHHLRSQAPMSCLFVWHPSQSQEVIQESLATLFRHLSNVLFGHGLTTFVVDFLAESFWLSHCCLEVADAEWLHLTEHWISKYSSSL